jgi:hypothetical protein
MANEHDILAEALQSLRAERLDCPPHSPDDDDVCFVTESTARLIIREAMRQARREALRGN